MREPPYTSMNDEPITYTNARACIDISCNRYRDLHLAHTGYASRLIRDMLAESQRRTMDLRSFLENVIDSRYLRKSSGGFD